MGFKDLTAIGGQSIAAHFKEICIWCSIIVSFSCLSLKEYTNTGFYLKKKPVPQSIGVPVVLEWQHDYLVGDHGLSSDLEPDPCRLGV